MKDASGNVVTCAVQMMCEDNYTFNDLTNQGKRQ
jgi:hypothetical protein